MYLKTTSLIGFRRIYEIVFIESNTKCIAVLSEALYKAIDGTRSLI